jgi:hypothetical protein
MSLVDSFPSSIGDYLGPLRWGLLALNCGLILAFAGVMRRATEQMDTHIARVKKYGKEKAERSRNVLFVIAHPDDEAMFFVPTILSLNGYPGYRSHLLCLSSGNVSIPPLDCTHPPFCSYGEQRNRARHAGCNCNLTFLIIVFFFQTGRWPGGHQDKGVI